MQRGNRLGKCFEAAFRMGKVYGKTTTKKFLLISDLGMCGYSGNTRFQECLKLNMSVRYQDECRLEVKMVSVTERPEAVGRNTYNQMI